MKVCNRCDENKYLSEFGKHKKYKSGYKNICKKCLNIETKEVIKTKEGLISKIYSSQKKSSRRRGHSQPEYSLIQLKEWLLSNPFFDILYYKWAESGYKKELIPSIDRIDNNMGYLFGNITLVTWEENNNNARSDQRLGILCAGKNIIPVYQYDKHGVLIEKFYSMSEAKRKTGVSHISSCCSGRRKTAGGFIWRYS